MSDKGYRIINNIFGKNKEKGFFILSLIIVFLCVILGSLGIISSVKIAGTSIEFSGKEDLTEIVSEAVEDSVAPLRENFDMFYDFYVWNEEHLLTEEIKDSNPAIAEHAKLALAILKGESPPLPK
jgi:hypothetical protein